MVDFQSNKLPVSPNVGVNDNPQYDNTTGINGTKIILDFNTFVDAVEDGINGITLSGGGIFHDSNSLPSLPSWDTDEVFINRNILSFLSYKNYTDPVNTYKYAVLSTTQGFEIYCNTTTNGDYNDFYIYSNEYNKNVGIYLEKYTGDQTQYALDYGLGDLDLSGLDYNSKVKLKASTTNGEIHIDGTKVLSNQQTVLTDLSVTATSGSLPTSNQSLTIADANTPTVQELLEYCTELKAQIGDLKSKLKTHGLII